MLVGSSMLSEVCKIIMGGKFINYCLKVQYLLVYKDHARSKTKLIAEIFCQLLGRHECCEHVRLFQCTNEILISFLLKLIGF